LAEKTKQNKPSANVFEKKPLSARKRYILIWTGAILVFGTFIVNDVWREHLRDSVAYVGMAEVAFNIHADLQQVIENEQILQNNVQILHAGLVGAVDRRNSFLKELADKQIQSLMISENTMLAQNLRRLHELGKSVDALCRKFEDELCGDTFRTITSQVIELQNRQDKFHYTGDNNDEELELMKTATALTGEITLLGGGIARNAFASVEEAERTYERWAWGGYILYTLGWGLTLFGRIYGIEGVGTGNE
jgi:hypothetical protein